MNIEEVIERLNRNPSLFNMIEKFSDKPGIYGFFYHAKNDDIMFPFESGQLLYIGKTESSQEKRYAKTHFMSGKSGSSTFRISIGAILLNELKLVPIPRNTLDTEKGRSSKFKFDEKSENKLTEWLKEHIRMTFYEFEGTKSELDILETQIIKALAPPLNISKNRNNPFKRDIQKLRKNAAHMAHSGNRNITRKVSPNPKAVRIEVGLNNSKYEAYWKNKLPQLKKVFSENSFPEEIILIKQDFEKMGNRKKYSFNIQFTGGSIANNLSSTAVARDLAKVILNDAEMRRLLNSGSYKIRLDKDFILHVLKS